MSILFITSQNCTAFDVACFSVIDHRLTVKRPRPPALPSRIPPSRRYSAGRGRWPVLSTPDARPWLFPFSAIREPRGAPAGAKGSKRRPRHSQLPRCRLDRSFPNDYPPYFRSASFAEEDEYYYPRRYAPRTVFERSTWFESPPPFEDDHCEFCGCSRNGAGDTDRDNVVSWPHSHAQTLDVSTGCSTDCPSSCSSLELSSPTFDPGIGWFPTLEVSPSPYYDYVEEEEEENLPPAFVEFPEEHAENSAEIFHYFVLDDEHEYLQLEEYEFPQPALTPTPLSGFDHVHSVHISEEPAILPVPVYDDENCGGPVSDTVLELVPDDELAMVAVQGMPGLPGAYNTEETLTIERNSSYCSGGDPGSPSHTQAANAPLQQQQVLPTASPGWLPLQPGDVYYYAANSSVLCLHTDDLGALTGKAPTSASTAELQSPEAPQVSPRNLNPAAPAFHQLAPSSPKNLNPSAPVFRQSSQPSEDQALPEQQQQPDGAAFTPVTPAVQSADNTVGGEGDAPYLPNGGIEGMSLEDIATMEDPAPAKSGDEFSSGEGEETASEQQQQTGQEGYKYPEEMLAPVTKQMHYYFSSENLPNDKFLNGHMDSDKYIPLNLFLDFGRIKPICSNLEMLSQAVEASSYLELNETKDKVRVSQCRKTLTLRGFPGAPAVTEEASNWSHCRW
ncbi:La-related protein [Elysia marginata]|uniref:La-related protein n=1 Tax=Elysia marginata TaxID=1093978 RepID=A0AAV4JF65_9GAST|nr:La-related protein [Elysia marginata]